MKLMLGGTPVKKMMIHNDTMDATMVASDMQAGVTAYANGRKVTGTGKSFEFATYGKYTTNRIIPVPTTINVAEVASLQYPIQSMIAFADMKMVDFATNQTIGNIIIDNVVYPLILSVNNGMFEISCEKTIELQVFYGKDNYI